MHLGGNRRWVPLSLYLAKLYVQFCRPKWTPNLNIRDELIYIRDFEVVQKLAVCIIRFKT